MYTAANSWHQLDLLRRTKSFKTGKNATTVNRAFSIYSNIVRNSFKELTLCFQTTQRLQTDKRLHHSMQVEPTNKYAHWMSSIEKGAFPAHYGLWDASFFHASNTQLVSLKMMGILGTSLFIHQIVLVFPFKTVQYYKTVSTKMQQSPELQEEII